MIFGLSIVVFLVSITYIFSVRISLSSEMKNTLCKSLVICGPSGVGKGTLIGKLLSEYPTKLGLSVSHTSRKPREGEIDGVHYHFVDKDFILKDITSGPTKYIEHAEVHSNIYGTRSDAVSKVHSDGKICLLDVDCQGARQIKASGLLSKYLFIAPTSIEALADRLKNRGTETSEQMILRLTNAKKELDFGLEKGNFDSILINDDINVTFKALVELLRNWFPHAKL